MATGSSGKADRLRLIRKPGDLPSASNRDAGRDAPVGGQSVRWRIEMRGSIPQHKGVAMRCATRGSRERATTPAPDRLSTCRAGRTLTDGETPPGAKLHAAVQALLAHHAAIDLREVACLANCERGCSAAIAMPGKWTYLLGRLDPALAGDLLTYAGVYAASANGNGYAVPPRCAMSSWAACPIWITGHEIG
jgi:predicted metal-binding protein